jgi:hypothetical protein
MRSYAESMHRAMVWKTRGAVFVGACMAHVMGSALILAGQTSCSEVPCFDALPFDALRAVWRFPLFYTPWLEFPPQDVAYQRDMRFVGWFALNAVAACACYAAVWVAGTFGRAWWVARKARAKAA